ncbi:MAG: hypothetical protein ACTJGD_00815 [Mesonia hippocampi]|uniref:hypothetical protein n=1 Tax=Mesonia hippocampi TaxID=1628250 RepID=UPI003F9A6D51
MRKLLFTLITLFSIGLIACENDDNKNNPPNNSDFGEITLKVTGDLNANFSGMADFYHLKVSNTETWEISGHDYKPQTFSFNIMDIASYGSTERPSPGTYTIGSSTNADFSAGLTYIPDGDYINTIEYSTSLLADLAEPAENRGTLTITSSNEDTVKGHFECTAFRTDDELNIVGTIEISGEFTANKRRFD